ncbi:hypothetical protein IMZ68_01575, partial [Candidatus Bathyarchaeota archaeon]|nr:hypothetical protein [Candidatus Bathyarchaeota archaeon]
LASMGLALSFMPLFPQPLPLLLAVLVAFVTFKTPRFGMPIGSALVGVGLIFHLAELNFISMLGDPAVRVGVIVALMAIFVILPFRFHRCKNAIAINLGIISAMLLFFEPTYFLAVPLILASAVFFNKSAGLSIIYYALISVPLQILQYFKSILLIVRPDWWVAPGSSPPVYIPLNSIFVDLQTSMAQFRLYDTSKVVYTIFVQITSTPEVVGRSIRDALKQYIDSFPGIFLFLVIVVGIILALIFFANMFVKEVSLPYADRLLSPAIAVISTALFFVLLNALHGPLAFNAEIDAGTILLATLATALFTVPLSLINYSPKKTATADMLIAKAEELKAKLQAFEGQLNTVKDSIPVVVSSPEGKMLILKDKVNDVLGKVTSGFYEIADLDKAYEELDKKVSVEIDDLTIELNQILAEFQIYVNGEYSNWLGKLKEVGLDLKYEFKVDYQKEMLLEERINSIKAVLEDGRKVTNDIIDVVEPIYIIIRSLYDQSLAEECKVVSFAKEQLEKQAPWMAIGGLYSALVNWRRQYSEEVSKSIDYLHSSLTPIVDLNAKSEALAPILGDRLPQIIGDAKKAQTIKLASEKKELNVLNIITLRDLLDTFLDVSKDVLSVFYEELKLKEQSIENLLPTQDYLWEKNSTLRERLTTAMEVLFNPKLEINQVMENLPQYLSYIDESVQTLTLYNDRKEFLLNYPMAETAILNQLKIKKKLTLKDLPFEAKIAQEYLHLFYLQRFNDYTFDKENAWLTRKD